MFEFYLWGILALCVGGAAVAYLETGDVFHPLMFLSPMLAAIYWYMPWKLSGEGVMSTYLDAQQVEFVEGINFVGVICLIAGCFSAGLKRYQGFVGVSPVLVSQRIRQIGFLIGGIGFAAWASTIIGVGGFTAAFSVGAGGGWSDYGYVREAALALLPALMLLMPSLIHVKWTSGLKAAVVLFSFPLLAQGLLSGKRGPTFMSFATLSLAWYLFKGKRPALVQMMAAGGLVAYLILFLVTNRNEIHLGSDFNVGYDVTEILGSTSGSNEFIYGAGAILNAEQTGRFYWGRRYLAQVAVRPIPRQLWPDKYADFGVPELEINAGTGGKVFQDTLGWVGAPGSAPGLVADLWLEFRWMAFPVLMLIGWAYGRCWRRAVEEGGPWVLQYIILGTLSLYLVMQTGEAVIFRLIILSTPVWAAWRWANGRTVAGAKQTAPQNVGALKTA